MSICAVTIKQLQTTITRSIAPTSSCKSLAHTNVDHVIPVHSATELISDDALSVVDDDADESETIRVSPHSMVIDTHTRISYVKIIGTIDEIVQVNALSDIYLVRDSTGNVACMFYKSDGRQSQTFTPDVYYRIIGKVRWFKKTRGIPESHLHIEVDHFSKVDDANEITFHLLDCIYQHGLRLSKLKL